MIQHLSVFMTQTNNQAAATQPRQRQRQETVLQLVQLVRWQGKEPQNKSKRRRRGRATLAVCLAWRGDCEMGAICVTCLIAKSALCRLRCATVLASLNCSCGCCYRTAGLRFLLPSTGRRPHAKRVRACRRTHVHGSRHQDMTLLTRYGSNNIHAAFTGLNCYRVTR